MAPWLDGLIWADDLISADVDGWGVVAVHCALLAERGAPSDKRGGPAHGGQRVAMLRMIAALEGVRGWRQLSRATLLGALVATAEPRIEAIGDGPALELRGHVSLVGVPLVAKNLLALLATMHGHDLLQVAAIAEKNGPALAIRSGVDHLAMLMGATVTGPALDGEVWP